MTSIPRALPGTNDTKARKRPLMALTRLIPLSHCPLHLLLNLKQKLKLTVSKNQRRMTATITVLSSRKRNSIPHARAIPSGGTQRTPANLPAVARRRRNKNARK
jgi:hypothetical protein